MRIIGALGLAFGLSACGAVETVSRAMPLGLGPAGAGATPAAAAPALVARDYRLTDVIVTVPGELTVSEANGYIPAADIVWRGDPLGDRKAQIAAIIKTAFETGAGYLDGPRPVIAEIEIRRWHSITERARYTTGGLHNIDFLLTIRDAATGAVLEGPRMVDADLPALGGQAAIRAEQSGMGQKVRLTTHLGMIARQELTGMVPARF
ncbi:hypothetical protein EAT49_12935 [Histidinibacterium lentulum]|uniref:Lipoprotein n=1 Tax=Histidinibacterium lentulum TaxID=2480588 RepID=A0A3N2QYB3_9RHOB|nr:hypothetical protein EAT49_12935 [Histidinibacterium lentulum]